MGFILAAAFPEGKKTFSVYKGGEKKKPFLISGPRFRQETRERDARPQGRAERDQPPLGASELPEENKWRKSAFQGKSNSARLLLRDFSGRYHLLGKTGFSGSGSRHSRRSREQLFLSGGASGRSLPHPSHPHKRSEPGPELGSSSPLPPKEGFFPRQPGFSAPGGLLVMGGCPGRSRGAAGAQPPAANRGTGTPPRSKRVPNTFLSFLLFPDKERETRGS